MGWGECVAERDPYYSAETTATVVARRHGAFLAPLVLGRRLRAPSRASGRRWRVCAATTWPRRRSRWPRGTSTPSCSGRPLCAAPLAAPRTADRVRRLDRHPGLARASSCEQSTVELAAGYQRIKIKIKPGWDVEVVARGPRALSATIPLMADANAAYTLADTTHLLELDRFDLMMIEQPLDYDDILDHAAAARIATPICLDESIVTARMARAAIEWGWASASQRRKIRMPVASAVSPARAPARVLRTRASGRPMKIVAPAIAPSSRVWDSLISRRL